MLIWAVLGALIGVAAASTKGFSIAGGVIGGILLGPLAILMFLVSGSGRKCPFCAEYVKNEATVCKHCGKDLPATGTKTYINREGKCRNCRADVPLGTAACPHCKSTFEFDMRVRAEQR